jgi:hypothetical protein
MNGFRSHLNYANVMVTLLAFVVLGGTAWAIKANSVGSKQIKKDAVGASEIKKNAVGTQEVAKGALKSSDFADGQLPVGPMGPQGPEGPPGPPATNAQSAVSAESLDGLGHVEYAGVFENDYGTIDPETCEVAGNPPLATALGPGAVLGDDLVVASPVGSLLPVDVTYSPYIETDTQLNITLCNHGTGIADVGTASFRYLAFDSPAFD